MEHTQQAGKRRVGRSRWPSVDSQPYLLQMRIGCYWFRNDLRLDDQPALLQAARVSDALLPVFVLPERLTGTTSNGLSRIGPYRAGFLRESVAELARNLVEHGSRLMVVTGEPQALFAKLFVQYSVTDLWFQDEAGTEEEGEARAVCSVASSCRVLVSTSGGQTLYHPEDLPFAVRQMPDLFTAFRKAVERSSTVRPPVPAPEKLPPAPQPSTAFREPIEEIPPAQLLGEWAAPAVDPRGVMAFSGGETAGRRRLERWAWEDDRLRAYKETRNGLLGESYSSKLSAWLANGSLSPRRIHKEVCRYEERRTKNESTYWLIFELIWRDYYSFLMRKYGRRMFMLHGPMRRQMRWSQDRRGFARWCDGQTGQPFIDANMRELAATGYMSNRGRQNVASYLTRGMGIDWRMGAQWFEHQLLDYDPASNWGNWTYVAGVGTDPRRDRVFNPERQAQLYDPDGEYVRHWL